MRFFFGVATLVALACSITAIGTMSIIKCLNPEDFQTKRSQIQLGQSEICFRCQWYKKAEWYKVPNDAWITTIVPLPNKNEVFVVFNDGQSTILNSAQVEMRLRDMLRKKDERMPQLEKEQKSLELQMKKVVDEMNDLIKSKQMQDELNRK